MTRSMRDISSKTEGARASDVTHNNSKNTNELQLDKALGVIMNQTASIMEHHTGSIVVTKIADTLFCTAQHYTRPLSGKMPTLAENLNSSRVLRTLLSRAGGMIEAELLRSSLDNAHEDAV